MSRRGRRHVEEEVMAEDPQILLYSNTARHAFQTLEQSLAGPAPVPFPQPTTDIAAIAQLSREFDDRSREALGPLAELRLTKSQEEERQARLERRRAGLEEVQAMTEGILAVAPGGSSVMLTKDGQRYGQQPVALMEQRKKRRGTLICFACDGDLAAS
jgi:hypothetical protein